MIKQYNFVHGQKSNLSFFYDTYFVHTTWKSYSRAKKLSSIVTIKANMNRMIRVIVEEKVWYICLSRGLYLLFTREL